MAGTNCDFKLFHLSCNFYWISPFNLLPPSTPFPLAFTILCCLWVVVFRVIWKEQDMYSRKMIEEWEAGRENYISWESWRPIHRLHSGILTTCLLRCTNMIITQTLCLRSYTSKYQLTLDIRHWPLKSLQHYEGRGHTFLCPQIPAPGFFGFTISDNYFYRRREKSKV